MHASVDAAPGLCCRDSAAVVPDSSRRLLGSRLELVGHKIGSLFSLEDLVAYGKSHRIEVVR